MKIQHFEKGVRKLDKLSGANVRPKITVQQKEWIEKYMVPDFGSMSEAIRHIISTHILEEQKRMEKVSKDDLKELF